MKKSSIRIISLAACLFASPTIATAMHGTSPIIMPGGSPVKVLEGLDKALNDAQSNLAVTSHPNYMDPLPQDSTPQGKSLAALLDEFNTSLDSDKLAIGAWIAGFMNLDNIKTEELNRALGERDKALEDLKTTTKELCEAESKLDKALEDLKTKTTELGEAKSKLDKALDDLKTTKTELTDMIKERDQKETDLQTTTTKLSEMERELTKALNTLATLSVPVTVTSPSSGLVLDWTKEVENMLKKPEMATYSGNVAKQRQKGASDESIYNNLVKLVPKN